MEEEEEEEGGEDPIEGTSFHEQVITLRFVFSTPHPFNPPGEMVEGGLKE